MSRWQPDARGRLEQAALELFRERGFAETTVPEIAARAGLTPRTFFRHFADKREVLFARQSEVPALARRMIAEAPASHSPMRIIAENLDAVAAAQFPDGVEAVLARKVVIDGDEGLRERELNKMSALGDALREGFAERGVDPLTAALTAQVTMTVFGVAIGRWLAGGDDDALPGLLHDTLESLRGLLADG